MQRVRVPKLAMAEVTKRGENLRKVPTVPAFVSIYQRTWQVFIRQELLINRPSDRETIHFCLAFQRPCAGLELEQYGRRQQLGWKPRKPSDWWKVEKAVKILSPERSEHSSKE